MRSEEEQEVAGEEEDTREGERAPKGKMVAEKALGGEDIILITPPRPQGADFP